MLTVKNHAEAAGELAIFKALYLENMPGLIRYACNYVDEHTAEDLVQDLFIKIWQKRDKVGHGEGIRSYLFRSVQHACLDYLKHQRIETGYVDEVIRKLNIEELHYHSRRDAFERETERLAHIHREIEKLPERCREIFTLAYLEEKNRRRSPGSCRSRGEPSKLNSIKRSRYCGTPWPWPSSCCFSSEKTSGA